MRKNIQANFLIQYMRYILAVFLALWGRHKMEGIFDTPLSNVFFFIAGGLINNKTTLVQVMVRRQTGDKPLSEPIMA